LVGRATPAIVSQNNQDIPLVETPPGQPFWRPAVAWAAKQLDIFDREERDPVSATIRAAAGFSVPVLKTPQSLPFEGKPLVVGWLGNEDVKPSVELEAGKIHA
jgi:hypothetical protein